ncbi:MAG: DUF4124 domain-containing protein [Methylophilus sp.]|jgi:hypothetical protein
MKNLLCLSLIIACLISGYAQADGKIIKWVDSKGVTHYGDKSSMPSTPDRSSELNKNGMLIKQNNSNNNKPTTPTIDIEQARRDSALLASYSSTEEIDLALDRNTQIDKITLDGLKQKLDTLNQRLAKNNATQLTLSQNKKPIPLTLSSEKLTITNEITQVKAQMAQLQSNIDATRLRYQKDKLRYLELKLEGLPNH